MKSLLFSIILLSSVCGVGQVTSSKFDSLPITTGLPVEVNGLQITPPAGYAYLPNIHSFINHLSQTSISIQKDSARSLDSFIPYLENEYKNTKGTTELLGYEKLDTGYLVTFAMDIQGIPIERVMYIFQNKGVMISVMANYKQQSKDKHRNILVKAITSVKPI